VHHQTPSRILGRCFGARKGKERGNGLGKGTSREEKGGSGNRKEGRNEGKEGECNVVKIP